MDLAWSDADRAFRDEVLAFLDAELTPDLRARGRALTRVYADRATGMAWQWKLHARGWVAPVWPRAFGGAGSLTNPATRPAWPRPGSTSPLWRPSS